MTKETYKEDKRDIHRSEACKPARRRNKAFKQTGVYQVYLSICVYVTYLYVCMYVIYDKYVYVCVRVCACVFIYSDRSCHSIRCTPHQCVCVCVHVCACVCVCVCVYTVIGQVTLFDAHDMNEIDA